MAAADLENLECACAFLATMGPFKETFSALLDGAVATLQTIKGLILLVPQDIRDVAYAAELEVEITILEAALSAVGSPLAALRSYTKPWADCPPVETLSQTFNKFYTMLIADIIEKKFEVEQQIEELNLEGERVQELDRWIGVLEDFKDALIECK